MNSDAKPNKRQNATAYPRRVRRDVRQMGSFFKTVGD